MSDELDKYRILIKAMVGTQLLEFPAPSVEDALAEVMQHPWAKVEGCHFVVEVGGEHSLYDQQGKQIYHSPYWPPLKFVFRRLGESEQRGEFEVGAALLANREDDESTVQLALALAAYMVTRITGVSLLEPKMGSDLSTIRVVDHSVGWSSELWVEEGEPDPQYANYF